MAEFHLATSVSGSRYCASNPYFTDCGDSLADLCMLTQHHGLLVHLNGTNTEGIPKN